MNLFVFNTRHAAMGFYHAKEFLKFQNISKNDWTNAWHVCTYLNAFIMVNLNIITKFQNVYNFENVVQFWFFCLFTPGKC